MAETTSQPLRGLYTAVITPFDSSGRLALEHVPAVLRFQEAAGVDGVVVGGTNGEGTSLSVGERQALLEKVIEERGRLEVVAGVGAASVSDAVELARHASRAGAQAVLALPPFFYKAPAPHGLARYFQKLLDAAALSTLLYHIPQFSAVDISDDLLDLLLCHPCLTGIKDSSGDWKHTLAYVQRYAGLRIFSGSDRLASAAYLNGCAGAISGGANAFPEVVSRIRQEANAQGGGPAHSRSDPGTIGAGGSQQCEGPDALQAAQQRMNALIDITSQYPLIAVSKSVLANRGLPRMHVRPPLVDLSPTQEARLMQELRSAGYMPETTA
ncbi:MAG TPA: dihydrodipicolinate synthase family protein [Chthonomonadales bacterium]|nr:dihydrodipicolinate synthase family protein [Chthonomonadales bacterium]